MTGLLERADDFETNNALRFYPDNNDDYKEFERLDFGILLDDKNVNLPSPLNKAFLGVSAVRAEVTIRDYFFYGEGEAGEAYGELVNFKLLGDIKTEYFTKDNYDTLEYNSKDDYVNIRDKANGKIIGKILKNDMINNEGLLLLVDSNGDLSDWEKNCIEVYYLPPDDNDGKGTIHGFVHGSQIKTRYN